MEQLVAFEVILNKLNISPIIKPLNSYKLKKINKNKSFGNQLKYYRVKSNLTQRQLADKIQVSRDSILNLENRKKEIYNIRLLEDIINTIDKDSKLIINNDYIKFIMDRPSDKIKLIRENLDLNKKELARKINVSRKAIRNWENKTNIISNKNYKKLIEIIQ